MTRKFIPLLILLALASGIAAAHAMGLGALGYRFGGLGAIGKSKAVAPISSCSGTGLIFNVPCNSQYLGVI